MPDKDRIEKAVREIQEAASVWVRAYGVACSTGNWADAACCNMSSENTTRRVITELLANQTKDQNVQGT